MLYVTLYGTYRCLLSVLRMDLALVTKCVVSAWKGDKGGTVLAVQFIKGGVPRKQAEHFNLQL